jgi:cell division protein FtsI (penicillin-binding protein 3)
MMSEEARPFCRERLVAVIAIFLAWSFAVLARLVDFQVFRHKPLNALADGIYRIKRPITPPRGIIYDSQMEEMATSVKGSTVVAEPWKIKDVPAASRELSRILDIDPGELLGRMTDPKRRKYLIVKRKIDPALAPSVTALGLKGVYLKEENLRVYPGRNLASHTLGFVNAAGAGAAGLELQYNKELNGKQGWAICEVDGFGRSYSEEIIVPPVPGRSLVLSIDRVIQHVAQRELAAGVKQHHAAAGVAMVMESATGRILALAGAPDFNCNTYGQYPEERWRNSAIQDQFEPGSTFKVVVASAVLDAGFVGTNEFIDCERGSFEVGGHRFHDHQPFGLLTFQEILEHSSNIGAIKLGMRLGEEPLYAFLRSFGFGTKTGIDLPAEAVGRVRETKDWSGLSIASISFGQEVAVTSIQILVAINAVANGGYRVRPTLVDRILNEKRETVRVRSTERVRIMRPESAAAVRDAFEGVVLRGTGQRASLEGYRAAGKTGTAQKAEGGRFSKTRYLASFIGFAPLPNPSMTILVQIDEPKGVIYGGEVAAPVFQRIAQEALLQLNVPPDRNLLTGAGSASPTP